MKLKDKICLITGSTCGIGEAMARLFLAEGASVLVTGLEGSLAWTPLATAGKLTLSTTTFPTSMRRGGSLKRRWRASQARRTGGTTPRTSHQPRKATTRGVVPVLAAMFLRRSCCAGGFSGVETERRLHFDYRSMNGYCGEAGCCRTASRRARCIRCRATWRCVGRRSGRESNHFVLGWILDAQRI